MNHSLRTISVIFTPRPHHGNSIAIARPSMPRNCPFLDTSLTGMLCFAQNNYNNCEWHFFVQGNRAIIPKGLEAMQPETECGTGSRDSRYEDTGSHSKMDVCMHIENRRSTTER